ncbi:MAG: phytanoyl-CoA dioxygenase family protein [Gemmatimonadetes bacterium]|nr:phytanoyl-CoA dioxygenase family protein [Gemmatimonadota bacterium]
MSRLPLGPAGPVQAGRTRAWTSSTIFIPEMFEGGPFDDVWNPRLHEAFDRLIGEGRWQRHARFGWWPIRFPDAPGGVRPDDETGWHVDGHDCRHRLTSPCQGLATIFYFSDVGSYDGRTAVIPGSHKHVARVLAEADPEGLSYEALNDRVRRLDSGRAEEIPAAAGDVLLMHPWTAHTGTPNGGRRVRLACNPRYRLPAGLSLRPGDRPRTPVEEAVFSSDHGDVSSKA